MNHKLQSNSQLELTPAQSTSSGLTELVLTGDNSQQMALIMPMIAYLSKQDDERWITWITAHKLDPKLLRTFGVNTNCLRIVHSQHPEDQRWIAWDALTLGNSHTVIASPGKLTKRDLTQLENAAKNGGAQGILLRSR